MNRAQVIMLLLVIVAVGMVVGLRWQLEGWLHALMMDGRASVDAVLQDWLGEQDPD